MELSTGLFTANNVWMMLCTGLVFFMHLGFSLLEAGMTRQKNTINILFKNIFIICTAILLYYLGGFNLMYPGFAEDSLGIIDFAGFGIAPPENGMTPAYADGGYTWWTDFLFQAMFVYSGDVGGSRHLLSPTHARVELRLERAR